VLNTSRDAAGEGSQVGFGLYAYNLAVWLRFVLRPANVKLWSKE
jgi:hypothetical protein